MTVRVSRYYLIATGAIAAGLVVCAWFWIWRGAAFDAQKWRSATPAERTEMAFALGRSSRLVGLSPESVLALLGPADRAEMRYSSVLGGAADLFVLFDSRDGVREVDGRGFPSSVATEPFDPQRWRSLNGSSRLPMAKYLCSNNSTELSGKQRGYVVGLLGQPDQEWLSYELQGQDARRLIVVFFDGRVRHAGVKTSYD